MSNLLPDAGRLLQCAFTEAQLDALYMSVDERRAALVGVDPDDLDAALRELERAGHAQRHASA